MQDTVSLNSFGRMVMLKKQAVTLYAQVANAMYQHSIPWSFRLREMGAQSQRQHDALCRHGTDPQSMYLASFRLYSLIEQPEEKDEIVMEGLNLLKELETEAIQITQDESYGEIPFLEVQAISKYNFQWLEWVMKNFHNRFAFRKESRIVCATCGYRFVLQKDADLIDEVCPVCGIGYSFG